MKRNLLAILCVAAIQIQCASATPSLAAGSADLPAAREGLVTVSLDGRDTGRVFEGIGAVSAGASTRLLPDYPEPQRGQILDYLFTPKFGAGFQHLKVEIGGGENSTCGSEPSHAITADELADPKPRGYEFWLMSEARKRNPQILLDCLPWAFPAWIEKPFSPASADWFVAFLRTAKKHYGLELDWVSAAWNERGTDLKWVRDNLRPTLDAQGFKSIRLQAPDDDSEYWQIFDTFENDPSLARTIDAVGYHYIDGREPWKIDQVAGRRATDKAKQSGKPLWASEEWSQSGRTWGDMGALYVARLMNKLYILDRVTKYEIWCPIDSIYPSIDWAGTGPMQANSPWSGHYTVWPGIWTIAHTTQFAAPGWIYMDKACGQNDATTWRGSHVALRNPKSHDWSVIIVSGDSRRVRVEVGSDLAKGPVHVWKSSGKEQFIEQPTIALAGNAIEIEVESDSVYSLTTTTGQQKGTHGTPPAAKPFPFPFHATFSDAKAGDTPRYFSDQCGTFEVEKLADGKSCLAQILPSQGIRWAGGGNPYTLFGDAGWEDYAVEASALLQGGDVEVGGRKDYRWIVNRDGDWKLQWQSSLLASGKTPDFDPTKWHRLRLEMAGHRISGFVDGNPLATGEHASGAKGLARLGSTYHHNRFADVSVSAVSSSGMGRASWRNIVTFGAQHP